MGLFCRKKDEKIKELKDQIEDLSEKITEKESNNKTLSNKLNKEQEKVRSLTHELELASEKISVNECHAEALSKELDKKDKLITEQKIIIENDDKTIILLSKKVAKLNKKGKSNAGKIGGLSSANNSLKNKLDKATEIINSLNAERSKVKNRPTVEQLKMERVSVSHENKERIKK